MDSVIVTISSHGKDQTKEPIRPVYSCVPSVEQVIDGAIGAHPERPLEDLADHDRLTRSVAIDRAQSYKKSFHVISRRLPSTPYDVCSGFD